MYLNTKFRKNIFCKLSNFVRCNFLTLILVVAWNDIIIKKIIRVLGPILYEMSVAYRSRGSKSEKKERRSERKKKERKNEWMNEWENERERETERKRDREKGRGRERGSDRSNNYLEVAPQPLPHSPDAFDASKCDASDTCTYLGKNKKTATSNL